jgi:hypothetical protein
LNGRRIWWRGQVSGADVLQLVRAERAALRLASRSGCARMEQEGVQSRAWFTAREERVAVTVSESEKWHA